MATGDTACRMSLSQYVLFALVSAVLITSSAANKPRVWSSADCDGFGKSCTITLDEGLNKKVDFHLQEPIICPSSTSNEECVVVVNISNSHPEWVAVNPCLLRWTPSDWHQIKSVKVSTVQDYSHSNENRRVILSTQVVGSRSELYKDFTPADIYIESKKKAAAQCRGTGDPHYTTFDGRYWHYYDGNRRIPTRVTMYKSTSRDFAIEVQVRGNPAVACGLAGREGDDRVMINNCGGQRQIVADYTTTNVDDQPRIDVKGNSYTVYFKSGAWMRANLGRSYMNVYVESVDPDQSCGICGNFDGNPNNDAPATVVRNYDNLYECQKVCNKKERDAGICTCKDGQNSGTSQPCDIWEYVPPDDDDKSDEDLPEAKKFCPYEPNYLKPLIGSQDSEDITEFLKKHTDDDKNRGIFVWDDEAGEFQHPDPYDKTKSKEDCENVISNSEMEQVCLDAYGDTMQERIDEVVADCTDDYSVFGGPTTELGKEELRLALSTIEAYCIELFVRDGKDCDTAACRRLKNVLCPNECSGNGECLDARCKCNDDYAGDSCDIDRTEAPKVDTLDVTLCDTATNKCPENIEIEGSGFYCLDNKCNLKDASQKIKCRYQQLNETGGVVKTVVKDAFFAGEDMVHCPVPRAHDFGLTTFRGGNDQTLTHVAVSNDGSLWSTEKHDFLFFDSTCLDCDEDHQCTAKDTTCQVEIDGKKQCFLEGRKDPVKVDGSINPCRECVPSVSTTQFSYKLGEDHACYPKFSENIYEYNIVGDRKAGPITELNINASFNQFVNQMPGYKVTYKIVEAEHVDHNALVVVKKHFDIDANTGVISLIKDIDILKLCNNMEHCASDPTVYNGFFRVEACDEGNGCSEASVLIDLVPDNKFEFFPVDTYTASVTESIPGQASRNGEVVPLSPPIEISQEFGDVQFSFFQQGVNLFGAFAINKDTGVVTIADSTKLDYEHVDQVHCSRFDGDENQCSSITQCTYESSKSACHMRPVVMTIKATDGQDNIHLVHLDMTILDADEPPTAIKISNDQLDESAVEGTVIGLLSCIDPEQGEAYTSDPTTGCTYELTGANINDFAVMKNDTGNYLTSKTSFDFEDGVTQVTVELKVKDMDDMESGPFSLDISIVDVNEAPNKLLISCDGKQTYTEVSASMQAIQIPENAPSGNPVCYFKAEDPDSEDTQESEPRCAIDGAKNGFADLNKNELSPGEAPNDLNYEKLVIDTGSNTMSINIVCVDIPTAESGFSPLVSSPFPVKFEITDAAELPYIVQPFDQTAVPNEHQDPGKKGLELGRFTIIDEDHQAGKMTATLKDTDTYTISNRKCSQGKDGIKSRTCSYKLTLEKAVSASDEFCSAPDANGRIICTVEVSIEGDGVQSEGKFTYQVVDVESAPSGVSCESFYSCVVPGCIILKCEVDDADGNSGLNNEGFTITVNGKDANKVTPVSLSGNRRRRALEVDGRFAFEVLTQLGDSLELQICWQDNAKPDDDAFSGCTTKTFQQSGGSNVDQNDPAFVGGNSVNIPFKESANTVLSPTLTIDNLDANSITVVKLRPDDNVCENYASVTEEGNNFVESAQGTVMCLDKGDEIPFSADIKINGGDKLDILTTKDIDASYKKENPNFFVEIDKGSKTYYLRLNLIYKDACDEIKCPNAQTCSLCTINSDPQDFTITCPAADATKGYVCNSVDPGDVFEDIDDCENAMNCLELFKKFVQSADNECKFECSDETKDLAGKLHDKHCTDNPTGELKELCDQLNFNVILASTGEEGDGDKQASGSGGSSDDTVIIVVIVLVVLLILAIAVVLAVMKRKQAQVRADAKLAADRAYEQRSQFIQNAAFVAAQQTNDEFQPGVSNPLYDWYRPDMNRNDADVYLAGQGEGAFVVRDSSATPGWHLLCVKTQNKVLHDQIRMTDEGMYELLPTMEDGIQAAQPKFHELPELIDHYVEAHDDVPYTLALANPIYDNHNLMQARLGYTQAGYADVEAPTLPNKGPDVDGVANPMYGAGMDASDATYDASSGSYTGGAGYLDVSGTPGYLDVAGTQQSTQVAPAQTAYMDIAPEEHMAF